MNELTLNELKNGVLEDYTITLKKIQTMNTSDGTAYTCDIYVNSKKIGFAEHHGTGGCVEVYANSRVERELLNTIDAKLKGCPFIVFDDGETVDWTFDSILDELIDEHMFSKWLKQKSQKYILFRTDPVNENSWNMYPRKYKVSDKTNCRLEEAMLFNHIKETQDPICIVGLRTLPDWYK